MNIAESYREYFIAGRPLRTELGKVKFLTYFEYLEHLEDLLTIKLNTLHLYYRYKNHYDSINLVGKDKEEVDHFLSEFKKETLFNVVAKSEDLKEVYEKIFNQVFESEYATDIVMSHEHLFMDYRKLVLDMNLVVEEEVSPNEEIQKGLEMGRLINQQKDEKQTFEDIMTAIVASTSNSFEDVCSMTIYQVYAIYARIGAIFNYQTTVLFASSFPDQKIESWSKHIDLLDRGSGGTMKRSEFDKKFGKLL